MVIICTTCFNNKEFCILVTEWNTGSVWFSRYIISLNSVNQLIFVMVKCGVLFEVRTESLNNI
jgi:hypothetical protein